MNIDGTGEDTAEWAAPGCQRYHTLHTVQFGSVGYLYELFHLATISLRDSLRKVDFPLPPVGSPVTISRL